MELEGMSYLFRGYQSESARNRITTIWIHRLQDSNYYAMGTPPPTRDFYWVTYKHTKLWSTYHYYITPYEFYYITPCEFFTPALADGLPVEFEWWQVSSGLQDSSQYSSRPHQCCSLDGIDSSSDFQLFELPYQALGYRSKCTNNIW